jgi:hypothetical protein
MRPIFWIAIGAAIMFVLLKVLSNASATMSSSTARFKILAKTPQASNLIRTNEFRELIRTSQFKNFVLSLAAEEVSTIANAMTLSTPQK